MAGGAQHKQYKFMTTILREAKDRSLYIDLLEKVTTDPRVPVARIIISIAIAGMSFLAYLWLLTNDPLRAGYIFVPLTLALVAVFILSVYYLLSSRDKSLLESAFDLMLFKSLDRARMKTKSKSLSGFGIEEVNSSGVMKMSDGRLGVLYEVAGQMSYSMLPQVADQLSSMRSGHFISRTPTSQETLITSVKTVDLSSHVRGLSAIAESQDESMSGLWRSYMAGMLAGYIDDNLNKKETKVTQYLIVTDDDKQLLQKSMSNAQSSYENGIWSMMRRISSREGVESILGSIVLTEEGR